MRNHTKAKSPSNHGFSNQQALLALLVAFPLGLIALGVLLNVLNKSSPKQATSQAAPPAGSQTQNASSPISNTSSNNTAPTEQVQDNTILELGASSSGAAIRLLLKSIRHGEGGRSAFTYQLGNATIEAIANCADRSWISYPEHRINRPQSPATEQMLIRVCEGSDRNTLPGIAIVHDPPSNVRVTPNGAFLCTIVAKRTIRVGQPRADWYPTAACGRAGFIHSSQLQF